MPSPSQDEAFRAMFDSYHTAIQAYCWRRLDAAAADDAAADTFLTAWRRINDAPDGLEQRLWLYGIARNVVRNAKRSAHRRARLDSRMSREPRRSADGPETITLRNQDELERFAAVEELRPEEREILLLRVWEELSSSEIAAVLGTTPKAVDNRLARIRTKLHKLLAVPARGNDASPRSIRRGGER